MDNNLDQAQAVKINFYAGLRPVVGSKSLFVTLPAHATLDLLLQKLIASYPVLKDMLFHGNDSLHSVVHIFVNGRDAHLLPDHLATPLHPGDVLDIFPPVGGG